MSDKKKYSRMENSLQRINQKFISLNEDEKKIVTPVLQFVVGDIIEKMKEVNSLFKYLFESVFYGGSYYDGLKVGKPEEFDIDVKLVLPRLLDATIVISNQPGFIRIKLPGWQNLEKQTLEFQKSCELSKLKDSDNYLLQDKVLAWMQGIVSKALLKYPKMENMHYIPYHYGDIKVCMRTGGPAMTLNIVHPESKINIDVDLVASFKFTKSSWPPSPYRPLPSECTKTEFLVVPKAPKGNITDNPARLWRLSFQEQEREMMNGNERFKPVLRLMKKLRDTQNHVKISSYFLKTMFLSEMSKPEIDKSFWHAPLSYVFMHMLKVYYDCMFKKDVPYFWYSKNNLVKPINEKTLENYSCRLKEIIKCIEQKYIENPDVVVTYISKDEELASLNLDKNLSNNQASALQQPLKLNRSLSTSPEKALGQNYVNNVNNKDETTEILKSNICGINTAINTVFLKMAAIEKSISDLKNESRESRVELKNLCKIISNINTQESELVLNSDVTDSKIQCTSNTSTEKSFCDFSSQTEPAEISADISSTQSMIISSTEGCSTEITDSKQAALESDNKLESSFDFALLYDKVLKLEKVTEVFRQENILLKKSLQQYVFSEMNT